jgi:phage baseplate assembly protein V
MRSASRHNDLLRVGTVIEIDFDGGAVRVDLADEEAEESFESDWIPWAAPRAGDTKIWLPPSIGEQVAVWSPDGDLEAAHVGASLFSDENAEPGDGPAPLIRFVDGAEIKYDPATHHLTAILPDGGQVTITAPAHLTINADNGVTINGDVQVNGTLTASTDVIGGGKSLKNHKHTTVKAGTDISGKPQ